VGPAVGSPYFAITESFLGSLSHAMNRLITINQCSYNIEAANKRHTMLNVTLHSSQYHKTMRYSPIFDSNRHLPKDLRGFVARRRVRPDKPRD
jgi:hypothetical protein